MNYPPVCPICGESVADYKGPCPKEPPMTSPTSPPAAPEMTDKELAMSEMTDATLIEELRESAGFMDRGTPAHARLLRLAASRLEREPEDFNTAAAHCDFGATSQLIHPEGARALSAMAVHLRQLGKDRAALRQVRP